MPAWSDLRHAYGPADDVPPLLDKVSSDPNDDAWGELWTRLFHQGTVYSASFASLSALADRAESWSPPKRIAGLALAGAILASDDVCGGQREIFAAGVEPVVRRLDHLATESLEVCPEGTDEFVILMAAALAFRGEYFWSRQLIHLLDGEFYGWCQSCDSELFILVGEYGVFVTAEDSVKYPNARRNDIVSARLTTDFNSVAQWIYQQCIRVQRPELADLVLAVFGTSSCPACGAQFEIPDAIAAAV